MSERARHRDDVDQIIEQVRALARFPSENSNPVLRVTPAGRVRYANDSANGIAGFLVGRGRDQLAKGVADDVKRANRDLGTPFKARIGIHSEPVVAGIIGTHRFVHDVWGDTVNVASWLESHGLANRVQVSKATARLIEDSFDLEPRGTFSVKGKL